jgi:hypothetical protein
MNIYGWMKFKQFVIKSHEMNDIHVLREDSSYFSCIFIQQLINLYYKKLEN